MLPSDASCAQSVPDANVAVRSPPLAAQSGASSAVDKKPSPSARTPARSLGGSMRAKSAARWPTSPVSSGRRPAAGASDDAASSHAASLCSAA